MAGTNLKNYLITGDSSEILDEDSAGSVTTSRLGVLWSLVPLRK